MILRGEKPVGSLQDLGEWLCESIATWSPEEKRAFREQVRQELLAKQEGQRLSIAAADADFLKACGISWGGEQ